MNRRDVLRLGTLGAIPALASGGALAQMMGGGGGMMGRTISASLAWPTGQPLRPFDVLANRSADADTFAATLVAAPFRASLVPGASTELWGYGGAVPGPMIELVEGQRVAIEFDNRLSIDSTVHWHGLPVPPDQDGGPMDPVAPGTARRYEFTIPAGSAGTYWYHPHAHQTTTLQVAHGLAGPIIVHGANDPLAALDDVTLMVSTLTLDAAGQVATPSLAMGGMAMSTGGEVLVNGRKQPVHVAAPGATQRWRLLNATADRYLRLSLDGHRFAVVATDGGLLPRPLANLAEWLLAPGQRVEIVVTLATTRAARYVLRDLGYGGGMGAGSGVALMTVQATNEAPKAPVALPALLRPLEDLGPPAFRREVVLSGGMMGSFLIDGRSFDMDRVDLETTVGRVELWDLVNTTMMDHPIHVHGTQFQVVGRSSAVPVAPFDGTAWFDVVNVPAGGTVTIKTRQMAPGKRMVHCHILPHEDAGMMAVLEVRA